jgi:hypothetical protein
VKITGDTEAAIAYGKAKAAVASLPAEYKRYWQSRLDSIGRGLESASGDHAAAHSTESIADGRYKTTAARIAQGKWLGVADEARHIAELYRYAQYKKNSAINSYGNVRGSSESLVREIEQFLDMLDGFNDFYGDYP